MKRKLSNLLVCLLLVWLIMGCEGVQKGVDKPVRVGSDRLVIKHVSKTSEYTTRTSKISAPPIDAILVVVKGEIVGVLDPEMCTSPSIVGVELRWYDLSLLRRTQRIHCGLFAEEKSFVWVFVIPQKAENELFKLYFPEEDITVPLWSSELWSDELQHD